jgi:large subunit ribosomal protein L22
VAGKSFTASHRHARLSPYKARPVIDLVRGRGVNEALTVLEYEPRRAAPMIRKVIASALANALNDLEVRQNDLVVVDARVDGGPLLGGRRRFRPVAMGRAYPIRKRTCHIRVTLAEVEGAGAKRAKRRAGKAKAPEGEAAPSGAAPTKAKAKGRAEAGAAPAKAKAPPAPRKE